MFENQKVWSLRQSIDQINNKIDSFLAYEMHEYNVFCLRQAKAKNQKYC